MLRTLGWTVGVLIAPLAIAQSLAFGSFIFEEAIQGAAFATKAAMDSEDQTLALASIRNFENIMRRAQSFQRRFGVMAFWTHDSYRTYFERTAPAQLLGMYAQGKRLGLWADDVRRWQTIDGKDVDTWALDPIERIQSLGFSPDLLTNRNCEACQQDDRYERRVDRFVAHAAARKIHMEANAEDEYAAAMAEKINKGRDPLR